MLCSGSNRDVSSTFVTCFFDAGARKKFSGGEPHKPFLRMRGSIINIMGPCSPFGYSIKNLIPQTYLKPMLASFVQALG